MVGGVEAFDDSKGTNVGATVAALDGLGADTRAGASWCVILGGDGKGQDFAPLAAPVARHARAVALIGRDAAAIERRAGRLRRADAAPRHAAKPPPRWCFAQAQRGRRGAAAARPAPAWTCSATTRHRAEVFVAAVQRSWRPSAARCSHERRPPRLDAIGGLRSALPRRWPRLAPRAERAARAARRRGVPMRDWIDAGSRAGAACCGFDQPLVLVIVALLALGLVMVYSASIALPDNPRSRATRPRTS